MYATTEGTTRSIDRFPKYRATAFYGTILGLEVSSQFAHFTPGIASALVGMGRREHVLENLGVAPVPPTTHEQYLRLYQ